MPPRKKQIPLGANGGGQDPARRWRAHDRAHDDTLGCFHTPTLRHYRIRVSHAWGRWSLEGRSAVRGREEVLKM